MKKLVMVGFVALMVMALAGTVLAADYKDGEYIGFSPSDHGDLVVAVAIQNGYISNVEILSPVKHEYKYEAGKEAYYKFPQQVINNQSTDVDAISGATSSYESYPAAVDMALAMAAGTYEGNKYYGVSRDYNHGHVVLEVTLNDAKDDIKNVKWITKNPELDQRDTLMGAKTDKYPLDAAIKAFNELPERAAKKDSVNADIVSGATHTSIGFYEALLQAVDSAGAEL